MLEPLFVLAASMAPSVGKVTLDTLVRRSETIVLARVGDVFELQEPLDQMRCVRLAALDVERVLKGDPGVRSVGILASQTGLCDASTAIPGERALFFLSTGEWLEAGRPGVKAAIERALEGLPFRTIAHSGRGRMPGQVVAEEEVEALCGGVVLPEDLLSRVPGMTGAYTPRATPLEPLLARVAALAAAEHFPVLHAVARDATGTLELALCGDLRLFVRAVESSGFVRWQESSISNEAFWSLFEFAGYARRPFHDAFVFGTEGGRTEFRELWFRAEGFGCDLAIGDLDDVTIESGDDRARIAVALRTWAVVRALVDLPGFVDHRARDQSWIEAR